MKYFLILVLFFGQISMHAQVKTKPKSKTKVIKPVASKNVDAEAAQILESLHVRY
jgi:hypothetical protein